MNLQNIERLYHPRLQLVDGTLGGQPCRSSVQLLSNLHGAIQVRQHLKHDKILYFLKFSLWCRQAVFQFSISKYCLFVFYRRSHCFRELIVSNLEQLMVLTAETNPSKPLPPPRCTAIALKKLALSTIRDWAKEYGGGYKKLQLGISFLKNCKRVLISYNSSPSLILCLIFLPALKLCEFSG